MRDPTAADMIACQSADCDKVLYARGLCQMHYTRALRAGTLTNHSRVRRDPTASLLDYVQKRCVADEKTGCLLWQGSINGGYGHARVNGRMEKVHRIVWECSRGPIPDNLIVCHKCDVRNCANIDHLFLGTVKENVHDMLAKDRDAMRGTKNRYAKMTDALVIEIRAAKGTYRALAVHYGIDVAQISRVKNRQIWRHVV